MIDFANKNFLERLTFVSRQIQLDIENSTESDFPSNQKRYEHIDQYIMMLQNAANIDKASEQMEEKDVRELMGYMESGSDKIKAIKEFRTLMGAGLKEAKDEVERVKGWGFGQSGWQVDDWVYNGKVIAKGLRK